MTASPVPAPFTLRRDTVGLRAVLAVEGEIDLATTPALRAAVEAMLDEPAHELWLDLSGVTFCDSAGVHALLEIQGWLAGRRRRLAVICAAGPARRTLALTGADLGLPVFDSRHDAHYAS